MVKDHSDSEKETHSRNYMGYFFQLAAPDREDSTCHAQPLLHQLWSTGLSNKQLLKGVTGIFSCIIEDTVMVVFIYVII